MMFQVSPIDVIRGDIVIPGDKSISHRAILFSSIGNGIFFISNLCDGEDVLYTVNAMRALGVEIKIKNSTCEIYGVGLNGLKPSKNPINCGNSGTLMRLLCGLLSAQSFNSLLVGDESLTRRPMLRIAEPLRLMGAKIHLSSENTAPIEIIGNQKLQGINYNLFIPSAQVKSGILLASLYAQGETVVQEKIKTRDHTEKMMISLNSNFKIPGDISSAAFFIVAATVIPNSDLIIRQVGINPFRTGIISILKLMGANIEIINERLFGSEPVADIHVKHASLTGIEIPQEFISKAIDEFPVIFVAAVTATGNTILRGASELRVKESDRIAVMCEGLKTLGVAVEEYDEGVMIAGNQIFQGGCVNSHGDHRVAMAFAVAGAIANGPVSIDNCDLVKTSFPNFMELANQVGMHICLSCP